jgi:adenylosuccinate synthase
VLCGELDGARERGRSVERAAHLRQRAPRDAVAPAARRASELRLGPLQIGTTKRGIGPTYADKAARIGIRVQDLLDTQILREKIGAALAVKNEQLERSTARAARRRSIAPTCERLRAPPRAVHRRHALLIDRALASGRRAVRGRPGHAARPRPRHVSVRHLVEPDRRRRLHRAAASGRRASRRVVGVAKAYLTRVGAGPFPSEADAERGGASARSAASSGRRPGASARCGWLDLVGLRFAARVNGLTELVLTEARRAVHLRRLPVCVAYRLRDGSVTEDFPEHQSDFHHAEPVFEDLPGWGTDLSRDHDWADLPAARRRRTCAGSRSGSSCRLTMVGVGQRRDQILEPTPP